MSTTKAEYMSLIEEVKEGIWLHGLVSSLSLDVTTKKKVFSDDDLVTVK